MIIQISHPKTDINIWYKYNTSGTDINMDASIQISHLRDWYKHGCFNTNITAKNWYKHGRLDTNITSKDSPRFLCRPTTLYIITRAIERQRAIYTENSWFASPALERHISTFHGYRILLTIRNPYINRFTNHFSIHS